MQGPFALAVRPDERVLSLVLNLKALTWKDDSSKTFLVEKFTTQIL